MKGTPAAATIHQVSAEQWQARWSRDAKPAFNVRPGEAVGYTIADASGDQLHPSSTAADIPNTDFSRVNPVYGPVFVEGARPGDTLQVEVLEVRPGSWGWTGMFPGFGLLADEFPEPYYRTWSLEAGIAHGFPGVRIPVEPFCGIMGVAWDEPGEHSTIPPRDWGGNQDIKQLIAGTKLYLPVALEGAIFSVGDPHAAQGDGEVCGTAIEMPAEVALRFSVRRDLALSQPAFEVPGPVNAGTAAQGYFVTTSHSPDLIEAARQSVRNMITHLGRAHGLEPADAYALVSVAGDLKISEVVDAPDWIVSTFLPRSIFTTGTG